MVVWGASATRRGPGEEALGADHRIVHQLVRAVGDGQASYGDLAAAHSQPHNDPLVLAENGRNSSVEAGAE